MSQASVNNPSYRGCKPTVNQSGEVIKMSYTNIYRNIIVYQTYIGTSIKVGCATLSLHASSGPKAEEVPTNNQRGRGSGPCRLWGGLDKARHIVPIALLVQRLRNYLYKTVKRPITRPKVLSIIAWSYWYLNSLRLIVNLELSRIEKKNIKRGELCWM